MGSKPKNQSAFKIAGLTFLGLGLAQAASAAAPQAKPSIRPKWAKTANIARKDSNAYLNSREVIRDPGMIEGFFNSKNEKMACAFRQEYELKQAAHDQRRSAGLTRTEDERTFNNDMKGFSKRAMEKLSRVHVKAYESRLKNFAEDIGPEARQPIALAVLAASLYTGKTFKFRLAGMRVESRADGKDREASFAMMPVPGLRTSVSYSGRENETNGQLEAALIRNVNAVVETADKGSVSLKYGVQF